MNLPSRITPRAQPGESGLSQVAKRASTRGFAGKDWAAADVTRSARPSGAIRAVKAAEAGSLGTDCILGRESVWRVGLRVGLKRTRCLTGTTMAMRRRTHYRILYFFYGQVAVVPSHLITKEGAVPDAEIDRAILHKSKFEIDPDAHTLAIQE
jgi:hypothetical protein